MPPDCGEDRKHRLTGLGQLADDHLALHLEADDEEEHRHEPVVDPVLERLLEGPRPDVDPDLDVQEAFERHVGGRVGDDEREDGRAQENDAAGDLETQELGEPAEEARASRFAARVPPRAPSHPVVPPAIRRPILDRRHCRILPA